MWGREAPRSRWDRLSDHVDDPHVREINQFVRELRAKQGRFVPFVSPNYGGVNARLLALNKTPGALTDPANGGSGFLDFDNRDQGAVRHSRYLREAGIEFSDVLSWNAIPWVDANFEEGDDYFRGAQAFVRVIEMMPELRVIMLHGSQAKAMWNGIVQKSFSRIYERYNPIQTWSLGYELVNRANNSREEIDRYERELGQSFSKAERLLRYAPPPMKRTYIEGDDDADSSASP
ncbi:hypothetical protein [Gordonia amicalis]|uniref:hypothetical protein n=1 Tax=Gordonia amicalis TaxID=89053 RepID=UPI003A80C7AA